MRRRTDDPDTRNLREQVSARSAGGTSYARNGGGLVRKVVIKVTASASRPIGGGLRSSSGRRVGAG